jgi:inorganic pyrophosphatase/exopolyphosphatase
MRTFDLDASIHRRTLSLTSNLSTTNRDIIVIGHRNPDTDAITAAIAYTDLLQRLNKPAKAYRLGELNNETKFVLEQARIQQPDMLPEHVPDGTEVALVDHNESMLHCLAFVSSFDSHL